MGEQPLDAVIQPGGKDRDQFGRELAIQIDELAAELEDPAAAARGAAEVDGDVRVGEQRRAEHQPARRQEHISERPLGRFGQLEFQQSIGANCEDLPTDRRRLLRQIEERRGRTGTRPRFGEFAPPDRAGELQSLGRRQPHGHAEPREILRHRVEVLREQAVLECGTEQEQRQPRGIPRAELESIDRDLGEVLRGVDGEFASPNPFEQLGHGVDFVLAERRPIRRLECLRRGQQLDIGRALLGFGRGRFDEPPQAFDPLRRSTATDRREAESREVTNAASGRGQVRRDFLPSRIDDADTGVGQRGLQEPQPGVESPTDQCQEHRQPEGWEAWNEPHGQQPDRQERARDEDGNSAGSPKPMRDRHEAPRRFGRLHLRDLPAGRVSHLHAVAVPRQAIGGDSQRRWQRLDAIRRRGQTSRTKRLERRAGLFDEWRGDAARRSLPRGHGLQHLLRRRLREVVLARSIGIFRQCPTGFRRDSDDDALHDGARIEGLAALENQPVAVPQVDDQFRPGQLHPALGALQLHAGFGRLHHRIERRAAVDPALELDHAFECARPRQPRRQRADDRPDGLGGIGQ